MRSFLRLLSLCAFAFLLHAPTLRADEPMPDEAATARARAALEKLTEAKDEYCGTTTFGIHMEGNLIGYMQATLKRAPEGSEADYEFALEAKLAAGPMRMHRKDTGTLDEQFGLLSLKGESVQAQGDAKQSKSYSIAIKDEAYHYTLSVDGGAPKTTAIETDVDSVDGIEMLAVKYWVRLPAGEVHRFAFVEGEDGDVVPTNLSTSAPRKLGDRDVVDVKSVNLKKMQAASYVADAKTGEILELTLEGAPFALKLLSPEALKAWQDANK